MNHLFAQKLLLPLASLLVAPFAGATIQLGQTVTGNVFFTDQAVTIPVQCDGDRLEWSATDFHGTVIKRGAVTPVGGRATLAPALGRRGHFDLKIVEKRGGAVLSEKSTSLAVLTPLSLTGRESSPFGVQTHSAQNGDLRAYDLFARAGIVHFRDEHYWEHIETQPLRYRYPAMFTDYMARAASAKMQPLITLDWSNPFYDFEAGMFTAPHTDGGRAGYAAYGAEIVRQYPALQAVEIWNEYNAGTFIAGPATAKKPVYYKRMLEQAANRIRSVRSDVKIVAGGTVPVTHGFLRDVFAQGATPFLDVVSVHPYRDTPEGIDAEMAELRDLIKRHNNGAEKPIWATEFSHETNQPEQQREAATYLAQVVTLMLSQKVERMYYYLGVDDHAFPHRGLLASAQDAKGALVPHPAYVAYANLIRQLRAYTYHSRFPTASSSTHAFRFQNGTSRMSVLWAAAPVTVKLKTASPVLVTDLMGHTRSLAPSGGVVKLRLDRNAQYVKGPVAAVLEQGNTLLADSLSGYSNQQGQNGWSYGSADVGQGPYDPARFTAMRWDYAGDNAVCWLNDPWHFVAVEQMHPSSAWAVRRWTSPVAATATLKCKVRRGGSGDGVGINLYVDGTHLYSRVIRPGESDTFDVTNVVLRAGSKVDFTVNQNGESSYDSTGFSVQIFRQ
jgi:hypothetical protein